LSQLPAAAGPLRDRNDGREPVLDGIRGLAIALVLFHHCVVYSGMSRDHVLDYLVQRAGQTSWLGVDLFFVLSGFLITGILYDTRSSQHYFRNFYGRRALRIFPLYYTFLAGSFLVLPWFLAPESGRALTAGQAWYWLYLSNFDIAFNGWPDPLHFGHFWSLAIEEQFYLVWPFVVYAFGRTQLLRISAVCFAGALALRFLLLNWLEPLANYVLMPTRMDAFAAGAFVALVMRGPDGLRSLGRWPIGLLIGSFATLAALLVMDVEKSTDFPVVRTVGFSIIAAGFAALIAVALSWPAKSLLRRLFASGLPVMLGKYSYALYIFHQPIMILMRDRGLSVALLPTLGGSSLPGLLLFSAIACGLTMLCALLSWRLIEHPCLRLKRHFSASDRDAGLASTRRCCGPEIPSVSGVADCPQMRRQPLDPVLQRHQRTIQQLSHAPDVRASPQHVTLGQRRQELDA
jgi:peptidoglycan/LPS O-acetylase OafA/YrhL